MWHKNYTLKIVVEARKIIWTFLLSTLTHLEALEFLFLEGHVVVCCYMRRAEECWSNWTCLLCLLQGWTLSQWICLWIQIVLTQQILTVCCVAAHCGSLSQHHVGTPIAGCVWTAVWTTALPVLSVWRLLLTWVSEQNTGLKVRPLEWYWML